MRSVRVRTFVAVGLLALGWSRAAADEENYTLKAVQAPAPKELSESIRNLLGTQSLQIFDAKGGLYCEIWLRKTVPAKATAEQIKNGLTYQEIEPTTVLGAIRFSQAGRDYRKQQVKPGVYTLRLVSQPVDGDHMGTAPHPEFCLLIAADKDASPDTFEPTNSNILQRAKPEKLSHPHPFLLFPNDKPDKTPVLVKHDAHEGHWVLKIGLPAQANGQNAVIGFALTVVGHEG